MKKTFECNKCKTKVENKSGFCKCGGILIPVAKDKKESKSGKA